jgi:hypothetical protein
MMCLSVAGEADPAGVPGFTRREDPVVIRGADLAPLAGHPTQALRLLSVRQGQLVPVPFQIDMFDAGRRPILKRVRERENRPWQVNPALALHPTFEAADELVLLARDLGPRADPAQLPTRFAVEIVATDTNTGASAYTYLLELGTNAPFASVDYISYDPERRMVQSHELSHGCRDAKHPAVLDYLSIGDSSNLISRLQTRLRVSTFFGCINMNRDENDIQARVLSYTDGPVRILLSQDSRVTSVFWMQSDWVERLIVSYPTRIEVPTHIKIPFRPGLLLSGARAQMILGFNAAASNLVVQHPAVKEPIPLSIGAPVVEREVDLSVHPKCWIWGPGIGLMVMFREDPRFINTRLSRAFVCRPASDEPATERRNPAIEMQMTGIENIQPGEYDFPLILSGRRNLRPGEEIELEQIDTAPLRISATPIRRDADSSAKP